MTISGTRLLADGDSFASITLAGTAIQTLVNFSNTTINVVVDHADAGQGDVTLVVNTGGIVTLEDGWSYRKEAEILAVTPAVGHEGTEVSIYGTSLRCHGEEVISVTLAGIEATIEEETDLFVLVTATESNARFGDVFITADGGATVVKEDACTYVAKGSIEDVSPNKGQIGSIVVITGSNLLAGTESATAVLLSGVSAAILEQNNTYIKVRVNAGNSVGAGDVRIVTDSGAFIVLEDGWEYLDAGDINDVSPSSGQFGTIVSITGTSLLGGGGSITSITLAGIAVEQIVNQTNELIRVVAADASARSGDIVIRVDTGAVVTRLDGWQYLELGNVTAVVPTVDQNVTIHGERLLDGGSKVARVLLAGTEATVGDSSDSAVSVKVVRAAASNPGDVVLVADTGAVITQSKAFAYLEEGDISSVEPNNGQRGTYVTISGDRLPGGGDSDRVITVTLAGVEAELLNQTDAFIDVRAVASDASSGHVVLTSSSGAVVTEENGWEYNAVGNITSVSPAVGQIDTVVTIEGTSLLGGGSELAWITIDGTAPASIRSQTESSTVLVLARPSAASTR